MLLESEHYRRRERDNPDRCLNKWQEYERRKRELPSMEPIEYEQACQQIANELEI